MISLLAFIETGRLGSLGLGSTRGEVEAAFGAPPSWDAEREVESARIWKYGSIEIYFDEHLVWMIFTDDFRTPLHMGVIAFDAGRISGKMNSADVEKWLSAHNIEFKIVAYPWCDEGVRFEVASGVTLTLCAEDEEKSAHLCSTSLVRR